MSRSAEAGFTLAEMLVALVIFGMLSAAGVALLTFSVRAQEGSDQRLGTLAETRRAGAIIAGDLGQAVARLTRDQAGNVRPVFTGSDGEDGEILFSLVRSGRAALDASARPRLQKVDYLFSEGALLRRGYAYLDGGGAEGSSELLDDVRSLAVRYRSDSGEWRDRWDPQNPMELPSAVEIVTVAERHGSVRQLFLVGPR